MNPDEPPAPTPGSSPESIRAMAKFVHTHALHTLQLRIHGHEELVKRLALVATQHMVAPTSAQRLVLIGTPGCGKTTAALALAAA